jgi:hypothetical protein
MGAEQRKEARRRGRKRIREAPGLRKAAGHLIPVSSPSAPRSGKWRRNYENYKRKMLLWPSETPPCPVCRMWGGLPKRSWPNWEQAEEIRIRQNDRLLSLFECPVQRGFWHLGHKRSQFGKQQALAINTSTPAKIVGTAGPALAEYLTHAPISEFQTTKHSPGMLPVCINAEIPAHLLRLHHS